MYGQDNPDLTSEIYIAQGTGWVDTGQSWTADTTATTNRAVGSYAIQPTEITDQAFLTNYDVSYVTGELTLTPAPLTVTGITASDKVYDSTTTATLNPDGAALVGVVSGDSVTLNTDGAAGIFASKDAGTNITVQVSGLTISGPQAGDYTLTQPTTSANITKADATIMVTPYSVTYDGNAHTATGTATGVNGESLSGLDLSGTTNTNAGDYPTDAWTFTDGTGNYNDAGGTVDDSIAKADAVITVNGYTGVYDGNAHGATGTAIGVETDPANLSSLLHLGASFTNVPGGTADWTFDGNGNYNTASGTASIDITKADATIVVTPYSVTYDGNAHTATGTATGVNGGVTYDGNAHTATGTATGVNGESLSGLDLSGTTHTNAGTHDRHLDLHRCHGQLPGCQRYGQ